MQILNGNPRYKLPKAEDGTELVCVRLDDGDIAMVRPVGGIKDGAIRVGKTAYKCAFVSATITGYVQPVWAYLSKSAFLSMMVEVAQRNAWGCSIRCMCRGTTMHFHPVGVSSICVARNVLIKMDTEAN